MADWINAYQTACTGATIDYQADRLRCRRQDFINNQTSFAGSDSALKGDDKTNANARCATGPAINIPMVGGAIAIAYNVEGVDQLTLTPAVIAGIFGNTITKWNDPKIAAANTGVTLPDADDRAVPPLRLVRHDRQLHQVPHGRVRRRLDVRAAARTGPAPGGQGAKGSRRRGRGASRPPRTPSATSSSRSPRAQASTAAKVDNGGGAVERHDATSAAKTIVAARSPAPATT